MAQGYVFKGEDYSWARMKFSINNTPVMQLTEVKLEVKQEKKLNYGAGVYPISYGKGPKAYTVSVKLSMAEVAVIMEAAPFKALEELPPFDFIITCVNSDLPILVIKCQNCQFTGNKLESKQGDMTVEAEYELLCPFIDFGGGIPAV
jgi:hypothetical protein